MVPAVMIRLLSRPWKIADEASLDGESRVTKFSNVGLVGSDSVDVVSTSGPVFSDGGDQEVERHQHDDGARGS